MCHGMRRGIAHVCCSLLWTLVVIDLVCYVVAEKACGIHAGKGPVDNLIDHLANPAAINFTTNGVSLPGIPYMQP